LHLTHHETFAKLIPDSLDKYRAQIKRRHRHRAGRICGSSRPLAARPGPLEHYRAAAPSFRPSPPPRTAGSGPGDTDPATTTPTQEVTKMRLADRWH
jgi:hypothetical protein